MEKVVSHMEAWKDFYEWMQKRKDSGEIIAIPKDVQEAKYAYTGERRYGLGEKRIKSLLAKYAPERYEFRESVIIHET